jgi:hypothetical protein
MERDLPAGLSDAQRNVLSEFFAGRIPAGQLTKRLGIESPQVARQDAAPDVRPPRGMSIPGALRGLATRHSIAPSAPSRPGTRLDRA